MAERQPIQAANFESKCPLPLRGRAGALAFGMILALWGALIAAPSASDDKTAASTAENVTRPAAPAKVGAADATPASGVTRADLAASYLRLEQAYFARPPQGDKNAEVNKGFDRATLAFFGGRNAEAVRTIDAITESLRPNPVSPAEQAAISLKVSIEPPVWTLERPAAAVAKVSSIYDLPLPEPAEVPLKLRIVEAGGQSVFERGLTVRVGRDLQVDATVPLDVAASRLAPGLYRVELLPATGTAVIAGRMNVIAGAPLDEQRASNEARLKAIDASEPRMAQAVAACRARNKLLNDRPSEANSAQFLADLNALAGEVSAEVAALADGKDPYARRRGDYWRVFRSGSVDIPLRIYAPEAATKDQGVPLLIVLHGAGGDENMFLEAYGAGVIKRIADQKGLLVASPLAYTFSAGPQRLEHLLEALSHDYAIDRDRVYLLGHSMGAGATTRLAGGRADTIAAACCIAGGGSFTNDQGMPPLLAVVAELDAVIPAKSLQPAVEKAASAGMPVELRLMKGYGHTLVVGTVLGDAVDWLLAHRRGAATK